MSRLPTAAAVILGLGIGPALAVGPASAQGADGTTVTCESGGRLVRCPALLSWRGARLVKQLSRTACLQGENWGFERNAIWVNYGCRGVFEAGDPFANIGERVVCASSSGERAECPADTRFAIRLVQRISTAPCVEGRSWGTTPRAIWVDQGCRGEFEVGGPAPGAGVTPQVRRFVCGTTAGPQVTCPTDGYAIGVRLVRDLTGGRCREGSNWGSTDSFIWVNRGCRGIFEVTYRGSETGGTTTRRIVCGASDLLETSCKVDGPVTAVRLVSDLSGGRCADSRNWGRNADFLWTTRGCRGEFEVTYRGLGEEGGATRIRTISCGTFTGRQVSCAVDAPVIAVRLVRDLGGGECREGNTFGYAGTQIWASRGCRGEFEVTLRSPGTGAGNIRVITCGTTLVTGRRTNCSTGEPPASVQLMRDLSGGRCREGSSWGSTDSFIWASRGCRAEFRVTYRGRAPQPEP